MKMQENMGQPHDGVVFVSYFTCVISWVQFNRAL